MGHNKDINSIEKRVSKIARLLCYFKDLIRLESYTILRLSYEEETGEEEGGSSLSVLSHQPGDVESQVTYHFPVLS